MCGIWGSVSLKARDNSYSEAISSVKRMNHRGPDAIGAKGICFRNFSAMVGMSRLSIVDRRNIQVPFEFEKILLAYNGEIYNHKELKKELHEYIFNTNCDAEVLVRGYQKWGIDVLKKLNGMFAFILIDESKELVFVGRDRSGEKPLYYSTYNNVLYFSSDVNGFPFQLSMTECHELDVFEYDCLASTPFNKVYNFPPAHFDVIKSIDISPKSYWTYPIHEPKNISYVDALEECRHLVENSIRIRVQDCEVPMSISLSGGLDSSIIYKVASTYIDCDPYTVSFADDGWEDLKRAKIIEPNTKLITFDFNDLNKDQKISDIVRHLNTPATWTSFGLWYVAKRMKEDGYTVCLTGEGADETFLGYSRYHILYWMERMYQSLILKEYEPLIAHMFGQRFDIIVNMLDRSTNESSKKIVWKRIRELVSYKHNSLVRMAAEVEYHSTMKVLLRMSDRMFSAFSMENRAPFLDHRLLEFASKLPTEFLIDERYTKKLLRDVAQIFGVPKEIAEESKKRGFIVPWNLWNKTKDNGTSSRGKYNRKIFFDNMMHAWKSAFLLN